MNFIDKKLFDLGYTIQDEGNGYATYAKKLFEFSDDKGRIEADYCHVVEIRMIFDENLRRTVALSSHLMGESCDWGHHCSKPLDLDELKWFVRKMRWLRVKWLLKRRIF